MTGGMVRNDEFVAEAELYDPTTGKFSPAGRLASRRVGHTAMLLPDGRVLIVSGAARPYQDVARAEIYDPARRDSKPPPASSSRAAMPELITRKCVQSTDPNEKRMLNCGTMNNAD
jgi:hypothetical protein